MTVRRPIKDRMVVCSSLDMLMPRFDGSAGR
jgi:hypothetical protein